MRATLATALGFAAAILCAPAVQAQSPVGVWLHANQRIEVEISACGDRLCGRIIWFHSPNDAAGLPLVDLKNPDPALRGRPLLGLQVLHDVHLVGAVNWEDGVIYNPDDGKAYQVSLSIQSDGALRVRGFVLVPFLSKTQVWTRVR
jgi:uncharacterized protein (DUF2147 family)